MAKLFQSLYESHLPEEWGTWEIGAFTQYWDGEMASAMRRERGERRIDATARRVEAVDAVRRFRGRRFFRRIAVILFAFALGLAAGRYFSGVAVAKNVPPVHDGLSLQFDRFEPFLAGGFRENVEFGEPLESGLELSRGADEPFLLTRGIAVREDSETANSHKRFGYGLAGEFSIVEHTREFTGGSR